jgi:CHAT domain-containing protein
MESLGELDPGIDNLVIVPDGRLHRLPFGALRARNGEPLGLSRRISYAPSATLWIRWGGRHAAETAPARELAFADPEISHVSGEAALRGGDPWLAGLRLLPLPYAKREAAEMVRRIGNGSRVLEGSEASERALKEADFSEFGLLHFAAHAVVDDVKPERSAILLSPGAAQEDGMLQIREIVDLELDGRVVILTACRSASGAVLEGEGVVGLARAFFQAGARAVVGSLWPLRDDEAALLVRDFGGELARGTSLPDCWSSHSSGA